MDLKKLEYLESIYRLGSFTKAAQEHYISQPSITKAISTLEAELDVQLIKRNTKGLSFTQEGLRFMEHVHRILNEVHLAELEMHKFHEQQLHTLRLAVNVAAGDWLIPRIYSEFLVQHPEAQVQLSEPPQETIMRELFQNTVDMAYTIISPNYDHHRLEAIPVVRGELCLLMPKGHPFEQYDRVPFSMLDQQKILSFPKGTYLRSRMDEECEHHSVFPQFFMSALQMNSVYHTVEHGGGLAVIAVDHMLDPTHPDRLSIRGFETPLYFEEGFLLRKNKAKSALIKHFIHFVKNAVALG